MSRPLDSLRRREALIYGATALGLSVAAVGVSVVQGQRFAERTLNRLLLPGFARTADQVATITITVPEGQYTLARGNDDAWTMVERGGFPVKAETLNHLAKGLSELRLTAERTRDPARLDQLGLGDPRQGGTGALLEMRDNAGKSLEALIVGFRPSGLYLRRPDEPIAYAAEGDLPPLQEPATWLEFTAPVANPATIVRVRMSPPVGPPYTLFRAGTSEFRIEAPANVSANPNATRVATALARWQPTDVAPRQNVTGPAELALIAETRDGLDIRVQRTELDGQFWLVLDATARVASAAEAADTFNSMIAPWAFTFTQFDAADWVAPLSAVSTPAP